jgi:uncharacterized pyridoxamine 5'-phosphate oxidase family protein
MDLVYSELRDEFFSLLGGKRFMVLATSAEDRVTARSMSCVIFDDKILFQTDKAFVKYEQMIKNPSVALCVDNIQIEGIARMKGHPLDESNSDFAEAFKKVHTASFDNYSQMKNEVVVEIDPLLVTVWKYEDGRPLRDFLDLKNKKACREYYAAYN